MDGLHRVSLAVGEELGKPEQNKWTRQMLERLAVEVREVAGTVTKVGAWFASTPDQNAW